MNIFVILPNYIGDALMATPAVRLIKKSKPQSRITALVSRRALPSVKDNPNIERFIVRENRPNVAERIRTLREIIRAFPDGSDSAVVFRDTFFNTLAVTAARARAVSKIEESSAPFKELCLGVVARAFSVVEPPTTTDYRMDFVIPDGDADAADSFLSSAGLGKFVAMCPGSTRPAKTWTLEKSARFVRGVFERFGLNTVLLGGPPDAADCGRIAEMSGEGHTVVSCGRLSLATSARLIKKSEFFVSPDTGPMHLAAAVGAPSLGIFGSTDPLRYGPYPDNFKILWRKTDCGPCYKNECGLSDTSLRNRCMEQYTVDEALAAVGGLLGR
ncbi:MAG: glycosyltransferase family 9 protein [Endomicrobiia bacterium]|nr:glycosyltransferase family 9 protein [Endomicrobiia bacterium]